MNISNAVIFNLKEDLDIVEGTKYNTALTIFFVPYVLFEVWSNVAGGNGCGGLILFHQLVDSLQYLAQKAAAACLAYGSLVPGKVDRFG